MNHGSTLAVVCMMATTYYSLPPTTNVKIIIDFLIKYGKFSEEEMKIIQELDFQIQSESLR
ncbi:hypothetical protein J2Z48_002075 [Croceifilum oryzae]|uniref:Uncharacterized protein n=1 Tax=Croceifilum oryzae TaxID=1553429 RepID=A0AAJ1TKX2_9BACL|nr:hypothetical protein [Croceifilum oryzae]